MHMKMSWKNTNIPRGWTWHIYRQGSAEYFLFIFSKISKICIFLVLVKAAVFGGGCQINVVFFESVLCLQRYF